MAVKESRRYRTDLDGLRGVAILGVVVYHLWIGKVSGGVDIFLFLSGYFFVDSQIRGSVYRTGPNVLQSISRTARRLFPALFTVIAAVLLLSVVFLPITTLMTKLPEFQASALFYENIYLSNHGSSYAAASESVSPLQNMWSMAIQGQFYLIVILAVPAVVKVLSKLKVPNKGQILAFAAILSIGVYYSFNQAINAQDQVANYYSSISRAWELLLGGLIAILMAYIPLFKGKFAAGFSIVLGLIGAIGIALTGIITDGTAEFPGWHALLPIGSAFLIILAGAISTTKWSVNHLLTLRPFLIIGETAYSWYLWHWPMFIIAIIALGEDKWWIAPVIFISSFVLARLTYSTIEKPLRQNEKQGRSTTGVVAYLKNSWRRRRKQNPVIWRPVFVVVMLGVIIAAVPYGNYYQNKQATIAETAAKNHGDYPGAMALSGADVPGGKELIPNILDPESMTPTTNAEGCVTTFGETDVKKTKKDGKPCIYGDVTSPVKIAVIGGSHSEQWIPALEEIAKKHKFAIVPYLKNGCPVQIGSIESRYDGLDFEDCGVWQDEVVRLITGPEKPAAVFTTSTRPADIIGHGPDGTPAGYVSLWKALSNANIPTIAIRDNPWILKQDGSGQNNVRDCLAGGGNAKSCGQARGVSLSKQDPAITASNGIQGLRLMDMSDYICDPNWCSAIVGNILVYRDSHHMTGAYIMSMIGPFEERFMNAYNELKGPIPSVSTAPAPQK